MGDLPLEIWYMIFGKIKTQHELVHLWTDCRCVSKQFRETVESWFFSEYLTRTRVILLGPDHNYYGGKRQPYEIDELSLLLTYDRLESDGNTVILSVDDSMKENVSKDFTRIQHYLFVQERRVIEKPPYRIIIGAEINDIELPGLWVERPSQELAFDWRQTFNRFFREEQLFYNKLEQGVCRCQPRYTLLID